MKQSTGRLFNARLLSRNSAVGIVAASVAALAVAACGGGGHDPCPNLPQAIAVIGQTKYTVGTPNTGGVTATSLGGVQGSVAASSDTLYVADTSNNRVLGFNPIPAGVGPTASFVLGQDSTTESAAGIGTQASIKFNNPSRVWVDPTNTYLVVADSSNNRVLIWNSLPTSNTQGPSVVLGQPDFTSNDANHPNATVSASSLSNPTSAIIANGKLIVVDKGNNRVLIWNSVPTVSGTAANLVLGQANGSASTNTPNIDQFNNGTQSYTLAMRQPSDAWTNGARLIVTDTGNHRVLFWNNIPNAPNQLADNVIGQSQFGVTSLSGGSGTTGLHSPWGVSSDGTSVFVADTSNNRVLEFTNYLTIPQNGPAASFVFGQQDFTHITQNDPDQNNQVGDQRNNPATLGPTQGTLFNPQGVFATVGGQLLVTDSGNSRVVIYTTASGVDGSDTDLCN